jgi:DNA-binding transcriptional ArsR family regulator
MPPDIEAIAEQVFVALADPSRRAILAALASGGPATATDLAGRLPITRQAIAKHLALLTETGLVTAEPGERRRVRYRLRSAPMQVAQQFLAALARDWDGPLDALKDHLGGTGTAGDLSISPRPLTPATVATCLMTRTPPVRQAAAPAGAW